MNWYLFHTPCVLRDHMHVTLWRHFIILYIHTTMIFNLRSLSFRTMIHRSCCRGWGWESHCWRSGCECCKSRSRCTSRAGRGHLVRTPCTFHVRKRCFLNPIACIQILESGFPVLVRSQGCVGLHSHVMSWRLLNQELLLPCVRMHQRRTMFQMWNIVEWRMTNASFQQRYLFSLHLFDGLALPAALCFLHTSAIPLAHFDSTNFSVKLLSVIWWKAFLKLGFYLTYISFCISVV